MVPLPIVERELRAASRRKSTHRIRLYTVLVASLVSSLFLIVDILAGQTFRGVGQSLFYLLAYYTFGLSLLAGIFFTADSISEEKREGTLGLLFLTDLRGVDVVLGKLASCGLATLYGLVAVLPVMALPLMMGGTTGGQFWRTALALVNNLFFALASGLLASTISKEAHRAMLATVGGLIFVVIALPGVGAALSMLSFPWPFWYISPWSAMNFGTGSSYRPVAAHFWPALLVSHAFAWLMIGVASWLLPRIWQEKQFGRVRLASVAKPLVASKKRRPLGELNPIQWLMERSGNLRVPAWLVVLTSVALAAGAIFMFTVLVSIPPGSGMPMVTRIWGMSAFSWGSKLLSLLLKIFIAVQACKFFAEARRSGALEIIMSTPLTVRDFIDGQWQGLKRSFLAPAIVFMLIHLAYALFTTAFKSRSFGSTMIRNPGSPLFFFPFGNGGWPMIVWQITAPIYALVEWFTNVLAIGWVGMWLGLSSKNPNLAPAMTILFVVILPHFVPCLPVLIPDLIFIFWARRQLQENFRRYAFPQQWSYAGLPGLAPTPVRPPVIRA